MVDFFFKYLIITPLMNRCGLLYLAGLLAFSSCSASRNLAYLSNVQPNKDNNAQSIAPPDLRIQPGDLLGIKITSLSPESSILFNSGILSATSSTNTTEATTTNNALSNQPENVGYLVSKEGYINFPVLSKVKLSGLTREEAVQKITLGIQKYAKNPIVDVRLLNFRISVLGEVNKPASIEISQESVNILQALAMAGDMTEFGKRENVLVIREKEGVRTTTRINLNSSSALDSPYFYLQQNDIVYVEPESKSKLAQTRPNNRYIPVIAAVISTLGFAIISFTQ